MKLNILENILVLPSLALDGRLEDLNVIKQRTAGGADGFVNTKSQEKCTILTLKMSCEIHALHYKYTILYSDCNVTVFKFSIILRGPRLPIQNDS